MLLPAIDINSPNPSQITITECVMLGATLGISAFILILIFLIFRFRSEQTGVIPKNHLGVLALVYSIAGVILAPLSYLLASSFWNNELLEYRHLYDVSGPPIIYMILLFSNILFSFTAVAVAMRAKLKKEAVGFILLATIIALLTIGMTVYWYIFHSQVIIDHFYASPTGR